MAAYAMLKFAPSSPMVYGVAMIKKYDPKTMYPAHGQYFNAVELEPGDCLVFSSGIIGAALDGAVPSDHERQIDLAWANVAHWLEGCGLSVENLVRMKMHLTDDRYLPISKAARIRHLGEHMNCAVTGVIVGLFDPDLVIEIDVVAARPTE